MSDITVYTTPTCPWCTRLKNYLKEKGVDFHEVDVSTDYDSAMKMVDLTGQRSVPVLAKGGQYVVGFNPEQIDRILQ
ncbi:MAG TPA: glutaredoxin family protein [Bacillota bacterium]|nr:glutaredoxin family protein [Bacillota bacterium]HPT88401.1 glutaredoxin family protein [Bacillota bacterium]